MKIFANARVYTMSHSSSQMRTGQYTGETLAEALIVEGDKISFVGSVAETRDFVRSRLRDNSRVEEIDCGGGVILPGFVDAHIHAMATAASRCEVDLRDCRSMREAAHRIVEHARRLPVGQWVTGGRWDANAWNDVVEPHRALLDELLPDRPVAVWSVDFHTLWLNAAALDYVGIDDATPDPPGGCIVRDERAAITGVLKEEAAMRAARRFPVVPLAARIEQLRQAQQAWLAEGIIGVHDFDGGNSREAWRGLNASGELLLHVVKYLRVEEWEDAVMSGWKTGNREGSRFVQGGLKLFSDGALGSQTCHMSHPFPQPARDGSLNYGLQVSSRDTLADQVCQAYQRGISVAIHAIGDQANHNVLHTFLRTEPQRLKAMQRTGVPLRPRLEHAQFMQLADVRLAAKLGVIASMQPRHCISDIPLLPLVEHNPGLVAYPWKDLSEKGVTIAFGSDAPVEPTNPFAAIYAAMTRASIDGDPSTSFQPDRRISAYDAVRAHTVGAAYAAGIEQDTGVLAAGKNADFIIVDTDPFVTDEWGGNGMSGTYPSEESLFAHASAVRDTSVNMTIAAGRVVYAR
ncbi:amidohydrolase [Corynebacterium anserum]|uniref:amidohydrolase n=1 Tax=Corynebacterium anserum TaxID=2684406 RepID=UPI001C8EB7AD|nr:amidohydrolase [Corynebacterium anserum]